MRTEKEKVARHVAASLREDAKLIGEKNLFCYRPHLQNGTCRRICNFAQNESYFFNKKFLLLSDFSLTATNTNRQPKEPKEQLCANIDDSGDVHCLLGADDKERRGRRKASTLMANQTRHDVGKECMFHGPLSGKQCWPNTTKNLKRFSFLSILKNVLYNMERAGFFLIWIDRRCDISCARFVCVLAS